MSLESEQKIKYEDNPDFNEVIDNENGSPLIIRGAELAHSYILYKLQPDIYQMALADHREL